MTMKKSYDCISKGYSACAERKTIKGEIEELLYEQHYIGGKVERRGRPK